MKYENARDLLPEPLLHQVQKYISGKLVYIPARSGSGSGAAPAATDRCCRSATGRSAPGSPSAKASTSWPTAIISPANPSKESFIAERSR